MVSRFCRKHYDELEQKFSKVGGIVEVYGSFDISSEEYCEHPECVRRHIPVTGVGQDLTRLVGDADTLTVGVKKLIQDLAGIAAKYKRDQV